MTTELSVPVGSFGLSQQINGRATDVDVRRAEGRFADQLDQAVK